MNVLAFSTVVSAEEYLDYEAVAADKSEYESGVIIPMPGGSPQHNQIMQNVSTLLDVAIGDGNFVVCNSETKVRTPDSTHYTYPDVSVAAGEPLFDPSSEAAILTNPCLIVEVLSKSTRERDRVTKFAAYKTIPTLREYLLIDQYQVHITHWVLQQDDQQWHSRDYTSLNDALELVSVPVRLPLHRIYRRVEIP